MLFKNSSNVKIIYHGYLFDKHVPRMLHQEGVLNLGINISFISKDALDNYTHIDKQIA